MKQLLSILFILFGGTIFGQTTYYVAANGNDHNNGTSPSTPFKTVLHATQYPLNVGGMRPGDKILFKRGDIFYAQNTKITIRVSGRAGHPVTIGAYGRGPNPIINGIQDIHGWQTSTNWENTKGNIWRIADGSESHRLWVNGTEWARCANNNTPTSSEPYSVDGTYLYLYSPAGNPATHYQSMQKPSDDEGVSSHDQSYITIENLDLRYFSGGMEFEGCSNFIIQNDSIGYNCQGTGIYLRRAHKNTSDFLIQNCTFNTNDQIFHSFEAKSTEDGVYVNEGADHVLVTDCRFINWGHAMTYWLNHVNSGYHITNCEVKKCFFTSPDINYGYGPCADFGNDYHSRGNKIDSNLIYHTGLAIQVNGPYLEIFNNVIDGTYGNSFYNPEGSGIDLTGYYSYPQYERIYNNTILNCTGYGISLHNGSGDSILQHNFIANNILYNNKGELSNKRGTFSFEQLLIEEHPEIKSNTFYNNLMYYPGKTNMVYYGHEPHGNYDMTVATFNSWNGNQGDVISGNITGDPLLNSKYQLQEGSPAIGAGMDLGAGTDLGAFSYKEGDQPGNSTH